MSFNRSNIIYYKKKGIKSRQKNLKNSHTGVYKFNRWIATSTRECTLGRDNNYFYYILYNNMLWFGLYYFILRVMCNYFLISNIPVFTILQNFNYTFLFTLNYICCTICSLFFTILVVQVVVQVYFHWHAESSSFQRLEIHSRDVFFYLPNCWLCLASISHRHHSHHSPVQIL